MLTTVLLVVVAVLVGAVAGLKVVAPLTLTKTDDKVLALLEKVPLDKLVEYVESRKVPKV